MIFNSLTFFIFLALFLTVWQWAKNRTQTRLYTILIFSMIFYGWWDWRFLFLILFTGGADYIFALGIGKVSALENPRWRELVKKMFLAFSLITGLGVLTIFKYSSFFAEYLGKFFALFNLHIQLADHIPEFCLILPVGISFYTFQSLSYTIDVYRGKIAPTRSFVHYMAYLMLFPQLVAGPIVRAVDLLPKLLKTPCQSPANKYNALKLLALGFFKKCVLADNAAHLVDIVFANSYIYTGSLTWIAVMILFSIQIYCDFSGYSDIARGIIKYMGYRFDLNFNHPYIACGMHDFWSRWHISLSSWFKDYLYIPLGGNKKGKFRTYLNLFITFLISGLWHGAAINFAIWGGYHALIQITERMLNIKKFFHGKAKILFFTVITQILVLIGWVFFRSDNFPESMYILQKMFAFSQETHPIKWKDPIKIMAVFAVMEFILIARLDRKLLKNVRFYRYLEPFLLGALIICTILYRGEGHGFIYFQF